MSRYFYAGNFRNPAENFYVKDVGDHYEVWVRTDRAKDGSAPPDHKHTSTPTFAEPEEAQEWIESIRESFEEDYDDYLEENREALVWQERYEAYRNEY